MAKIVKVMHDEGIGHPPNHPVDTCHNCGDKGVIYDKCPGSVTVRQFSADNPYLTGETVGILRNARGA